MKSGFSLRQSGKGRNFVKILGIMHLLVTKQEYATKKNVCKEGATKIITCCSVGGGIKEESHFI